MSGSPRSGPGVLEEPFNVLPPGFGKRPAGLTSVALRELHSSYHENNAASPSPPISTIPAQARPLAGAMRRVFDADYANCAN
jgi:hypothetical protein